MTAPDDDVDLHWGWWPSQTKPKKTAEEIWREYSFHAFHREDMKAGFLPPQKPKEEEAGALGTELEITPEMIAAGAAVLADIYDDANDWVTEFRVRSIFEAMMRPALSARRIK